MLKRQFRFHGINSLSWTYKHSRSIRNNYYTLRYSNNQKTKQFKVAIVVSRKVSKSAVTRNLIRRRFYEVVGGVKEGIKNNTDLIFVVQNVDVVNLPFEELTQLINKSIVESGVLQKQS